jgi:hypothetical protein
MARPKNKTVAVICAWRKGEDDLDATMASAKKSAPKKAMFYTVEDNGDGSPAKTRHRGITQSVGDIIIIIDAHMRFKDDALTVMAKHAEKHGLCCAITHHNEKCEFSNSPYYGARMVYKVKEGQTHACLVGKWSTAQKAGEVSCIMGGAYAFTREWYYKVGQPLAMLEGWGGDEESLSIASWLSGQMPHCVNAHIAHRYRPRPPWKVTEQEKLNARNSRLAVIHATVPLDSQKRELIEWQRKNVPFDAPYIPSKECLQVQKAWLSLPRKYDQWLKQVCGQSIIDVPTLTTPQRMPNKVVNVDGIKCPCCGLMQESFEVTHTVTYPNGNKSRRHVCPSCKGAFRTMFVAKKDETKV